MLKGRPLDSKQESYNKAMKALQGAKVLYLEALEARRETLGEWVATRSEPQRGARGVGDVAVVRRRAVCAQSVLAAASRQPGRPWMVRKAAFRALPRSGARSCCPR